MTAHWGVPDPAAVKGSPKEIEKAFRDAFFILERRITLFLLLGAFFVRFPLAGMIAAPPVIGGVIFLFLRWNPFHFLKNIAE